MEFRLYIKNISINDAAGCTGTGPKTADRSLDNNVLEMLLSFKGLVYKGVILLGIYSEIMLELLFPYSNEVPKHLLKGHSSWSRRVGENVQQNHKENSQPEMWQKQLATK